MTNQHVQLPGVGIFGSGLTARAIIYLLQSHGFEIKAIWDKNEESAKAVAEELDIPFHTSRIEDVLLNSNVELACIKCPPHLQSQIAVKTLRIGKMVLCDSPAGLGFADAKRVLDAAQYYPSLMSLITYYLRFLPTFIEMKKRISEGYVGDVQVIEVRVHCGLSIDNQFNWFHDHRIGGGFLTNFGTHFIDIVSFITGQKAKKVHGFLKTFQRHTDKISGFREITSDDFCTFQMQMSNDAYCDCTLNNNLPGAFTYQVMVLGTKAYLQAKNGLLFGKSTTARSRDEPMELLQEDEQQIPEGLQAVFPVNIAKQLPVPFCVGMVRFIESLKKSIEKKQSEGRIGWCEGDLQSAATFEDTLYVQSVLESICRSSRTSVWEQVATVSSDSEVSTPSSFLPSSQLTSGSSAMS